MAEIKLEVEIAVAVTQSFCTPPFIIALYCIDRT